MSRSATRDASDDPTLPLDNAGSAEPDWDAPRLARRLAFAYAAMVVLGALALRLPGATIRGNELSFERCVFTAVNAATLTGFQQPVPPLDHYGLLGRTIVMTLMVGGTLLSLILGGLALVRALRMPYSAKHVVFATLYTFLFAVGIGTTLLLEPTRGLAASASQAASAIGNCGVFLGRLPSALDWRTHAALLPLAVLGGLGIPVILELCDVLFRRRRALSLHSRVVLSLLAGTYVIGLLVLTPWAGPSDVTTSLVAGSTLSIDSRSAGLPVASVSSLTRAGQWVLIAFMLLGAAPAGAAGGMKVTALFHAWRGTRRALRREPGLRVTGVAAAWIGGYLALVFLAQLALIAALPQVAADRLLFLAASAVGNVGLAHEPVSFAGPGLWVLSATMLLGRAATLGVTWWLAATTDDADVGI